MVVRGSHITAVLVLSGVAVCWFVLFGVLLGLDVVVVIFGYDLSNV